MASVFTLVGIFSLALLATTIDGRKIGPAEYRQPEAMEGIIDVDIVVQEDRKFVKDFEPRPNISAYGKDGKLKAERSFNGDFEPRPNISAYGKDGKLKAEKRSFSGDFEPRPNISAYGKNDCGSNEVKEFNEDFEPRPNATN